MDFAFYQFMAGLQAQLGRIEERLDTLMSVATDIKTLLQQIDAATNAVAARLADLAGRITNSMSDAEVADIKTGLQSEVDRLTALGQNPQNPVPTP